MKKLQIISIIVFIGLATSFQSCPGIPESYLPVAYGQMGYNLFKNINNGDHFLVKFHYVKDKLTSTTIIPWSNNYVMYAGSLYPNVPGGYEYISGPDENGFTKYEAVVPEATWQTILVKIITYEIGGIMHITGVTIVEY